MRRVESRTGWAGDVWPEAVAGSYRDPAESPDPPEPRARASIGPLLGAGPVRQTLAAALLAAVVLAAVRAPAPVGAAARRAVAWALGYEVDVAVLQRQIARVGSRVGVAVAPQTPAPAPQASRSAAVGGPLATPMGRLIPPAAAPVSAWFGWREVSGRPRFNPALDLSTPVGTPVRAVAGGTVQRLRPSLVLRHVGGWQSVYGRCAAAGLHIGEAVRQGDVICRSSAGGLIFQLLAGGRAVDPAPYLGLKAPTPR